MRLLFTGLFVLLLTAQAGAWGLKSGDTIPGKLSGFDFESKAAEFASVGSDEAIRIDSRDLSLRSKQRLLISQVFLSSFPEEPSFPPEKRYLLYLAVLTPAAFLLLGFWIAGIILAKKVSPIRAAMGFLGGWMIGTGFVVFYLFFAARLGGDYKTVLFGAGLGLMFLSVFISAVYACSIFKGFMIFLAQIFVAFFLSVTTLALTESLLDQDEVESFWNRHAFEPVGLVSSDG